MENCKNLNCSCNLPRKFWIEMTEDNENPTGNLCWSWYPDDKPIIGNWIEVEEIKHKKEN